MILGFSPWEVLTISIKDFGMDIMEKTISKQMGKEGIVPHPMRDYRAMPYLAIEKIS